MTVNRADGAVRFRTGVLSRTANLVLARPERDNAIDFGFAEDLLGAVRAASRSAANGDIDCVVLSAEGSAFCVGGDIRDFPADPRECATHLRQMSMRSHEAFALLHELPVPIVTRVQGAAAGAGLALAAVGDVVIASEAARFVAGYAGIGLSPDCGVSWLLPRLIGERHTMALLLGNRGVDAAEAERWGLVTRVVPPEELDAAVDAVARSVLAVGLAGRETKRLLRCSRANSLRSHLADEGKTIAALGASESAIASRADFLARRRTDRTETS